MNIDPLTLTEAQLTVLQKMTRALTERIDTSFVFCFALQQFESTCMHCFAPEISKRSLKVDALLVYSDNEPRSPHDIQCLANNLYMEAHQFAVVPMVYSDVMQRLDAGDAFICKVFQYGALLYDQSPMLPQRRGLVSYETLLRETREGWYRWFNNSCQFMDCASYCLVEHHFGMTVFMIHQVVEQACKALLKVMLHMKPNTHNLAWMLKLCSSLAPEIATIFPRESAEDQALFNLLKQSYNDSRYAVRFEVKEEEAWVLYYRASALLRIAGELCNRRIAEMEKLIGSQAS